MKCSNHTEVDATGICIHCGKALCASCVVRSESGRTACSTGCAGELLATEQALRSLRHRTVRAAKLNAFFCFMLAAGLLAFSVVPLREHIWEIAAFVLVCAAGFGFGGFAYLRVARTKDSHENVAS